MGCDIHAALEYKFDNRWHAYLSANPYHGRYEGEGMLTASLNLHRNYNLFAILANVRNGYGFAGCDMGDGFASIAPGRGLPSDISPEAMKACDGDHSETWVSLQELLAFDWTQTAVMRGVVTAKEFEEWDRMREWGHPAPKSFCGGIAGLRIKMVTEDAMRDYVNRQRVDGRVAVEKLDPDIYAQIQWSRSYAEEAVQLWFRVLPISLKLAGEYGIENVRMVMNFDS